MLVANCPRCGAAHMTFDVNAEVHRSTQYGWLHRFEVFAVCRHCNAPTVFVVALKDSNFQEAVLETGYVSNFSGSLNSIFGVERFISLRDTNATRPPEHVEGEMKNAFTEGATCLAVECPNAAATMFRLCVDLLTRPMLPDLADIAGPKINSKQRRDLGLRLAWLFDNGTLPEGLRELAKSIKEEGNDGAHAGNLTMEDAHDIADFTTAILERLVTEPARLKLMENRRAERRQPKEQ